MIQGTKDLARAHLGVYEVNSYEEVKRFYMRLGSLLPKTLLERVGGREAYHGEGCDGVTRLGRWEFCVQGNTKNKAGSQADLLRCPGRCVQILGRPKDGWMSGRQFLAIHDVDPDELDTIAVNVSLVAATNAKQLRLAF